MVVLAPYDGLSDPEGVELEFIDLWLQVHKLPEGYRKVHVVKKLVGRVAGEVLTVEMVPTGSFKGDFVRVCVRHDVRTALTRWVTIVMEGKRSLYEVKYVKIGILCFACGQLGHEYKECGTGVFEQKQLKWGDWIHASPFGRGHTAPNRVELRGPPPGGRGRGGGMSDTFGRGVGNYVDWRDHPELRRPTVDGDLRDTATSPVKTGDVVMTEAEKAARKHLAFE
jgi:hypothetical protein